MSKKAVISIDFFNIQAPINFKKQVLLFDELIIEKSSLELIFLLKHRTKAMPADSVKFNFQEIDFLGNEGLLKLETIDDRSLPISANTNDDDRKFLNFLAGECRQIRQFLAELKPSPPSILDEERAIRMMGKVIEIPTSYSRALSIRLRNEGHEAYPIFDEDPSKKFSGHKADVLKFMLKKIPEPDNTVSWEQILDFKKDPDTMKKYYALIKWVNDVAKKEFKLNEIEDEYNYLYHDYSEQYRIHKLKYNQGTIQVFVTAAIDVLTLNLGVGQISSSLFSLWKNQLSLLEAETKFTGREIAYIHKLNQSSISGH